jgi:hypothetical protein
MMDQARKTRIVFHHTETRNDKLTGPEQGGRTLPTVGKKGTRASTSASAERSTRAGP